MSLNNFFTANWAAPKNVKTIITTRQGGISQFPYGTLNLATHVGDNKQLVQNNRELLSEVLPNHPFWLNQTHSDKVVCLDRLPANGNELNFDASFTRHQHKICVVMSADCLPVLLTDKHASFAAAVHAGWRGLENNIIKNTIDCANINISNTLAYIAPAICKNHYEVETSVFEQFMSKDKDNKTCFTNLGNGKFFCDLSAIAKLQLIKLGVLEENIYLSNLCTYCHSDLFYSYRRDGITGRIASFIWLSNK